MGSATFKIKTKGRLVAPIIFEIDIIFFNETKSCSFFSLAFHIIKGFQVSFSD